MEHQKEDPLEGASLFLVFETGEWDRGNPEALRSGRDPDARDEACIAQELVSDFCDPFETDAEEEDADPVTHEPARADADIGQTEAEDLRANAAAQMRQSVQDLATANELRELTLLDARPGKPYVYDVEVERAERHRGLKSVVLDAVGREYENDPERGLELLADRVYELGYPELKKAREHLKRFHELTTNEFEELREMLRTFGEHRIPGVDTREPLRLALECRNASAEEDEDLASDFDEMMKRGGFIPSEKSLVTLNQLVDRLFRNAELASEKSRRAWCAWLNIFQL